MIGRSTWTEGGDDRRGKLRLRLVPQPEAIQMAGIGLVILSMLAAEVASLALELRPGSEFLWWLNLQVFRGMNAAYSSMAVRYPLDYHLTIPILLGLAALTASAYRRRQRFALGMLSNAAFIWCGFTVYVSYILKTPLATAGIGDVIYSNFEGWVLMAHVIVASLLGFLVTQLLYWRAAVRLKNQLLRHWTVRSRTEKIAIGLAPPARGDRRLATEREAAIAGAAEGFPLIGIKSAAISGRTGGSRHSGVVSDVSARA